MIESISIEEIRAAHNKIADLVVRTPLILFLRKIHRLRSTSNWRTCSRLARLSYEEPEMLSVLLKKRY